MEKMKKQACLCIKEIKQCIKKCQGVKGMPEIIYEYIENEYKNNNPEYAFQVENDRIIKKFINFN